MRDGSHASETPVEKILEERPDLLVVLTDRLSEILRSDVDGETVPLMEVTHA